MQRSMLQAKPNRTKWGPILDARKMLDPTRYKLHEPRQVTTVLYSLPSALGTTAPAATLSSSRSPFPALLDQSKQRLRRLLNVGLGAWIREEETVIKRCIMGFKAAIFITAVLAVLLSSPALAQKSSPPAPAPVALPPSTSPAPAPAPHYVDLAQLLSVAGPFHTFLNYLEKTNVIETFQSQANRTDEGITIFVPKDSAFAALKKSTFSNLTADQLKTLLLYHAFPRFYSLSEFRNLSALNPVSTFAGSPYTLNLTDDMGSIYVKSMWSKPKISSSVYATDPVAIYALNNVLLPMQIFSKDPPLAPAPAPAPESGASDAPSPAAAKAGELAGKGDSSAAAYSAGVGVANCLALAAAGWLMLMW
ncbi:hypothetical protein EJB05_43500, partial [Eragrostis curvula]